MFNSETTSFQHFSPSIPNLLKFWTSNFGKLGQNRPQNLVHEKGPTHTHTDTQTSRLLDHIGPVGRFDENVIILVLPIEEISLWPELSSPPRPVQSSPVQSSPDPRGRGGLSVTVDEQTEILVSNILKNETRNMWLYFNLVVQYYYFTI